MRCCNLTTVIEMRTQIKTLHVHTMLPLILMMMMIMMMISMMQRTADTTEITRAATDNVDAVNIHKELL